MADSLFSREGSCKNPPLRFQPQPCPAMRKALVLPGAQSRQKSGPSPSAASPTVRLLQSVPSPSASTPTVSPLMTGPGQRRPPSGAADRHQSTRPCSHRRHHLVVAAVLACLRCVQFVSAAAPAGVGARSPALRTQRAPGALLMTRETVPPRIGNWLPLADSIANGGDPTSVGSASVSS